MLRIDYKSNLPIYEQICQGIVRLAAAGAFGENGQLPSVRSVAQELGINPNTVQKAYAILEREGVLCSVPGKGSFLTDEKNILGRRKREALDRIGSAVREALGVGCSPEELRAALEEALAFGTQTEERGETS